MNECENRKAIQHAIFWSLWHRIKTWCDSNPLEKIEKFNKVEFFEGYSNYHQTRISFDIITRPHYEDDEDDYYKVGLLTLAYDKGNGAPVSIHAHSLRGNDSYYLFSDCKTFRPIINKKDIYGHREMGDKNCIKILNDIAGLKYNNIRNEFTILERP